MSVDSILARGRARRVALMRSIGRIERPTGEPVFNDATGDYDPAPRELIYEGICQFKPTFNPAQRDRESGDREAAFNSYDVVLPYHGTPAVAVEDIFTYVSGDDAWAVGKEFPVGWCQYADTRTHHRITVWAQDQSGVTYG